MWTEMWCEHASSLQSAIRLCLIFCATAIFCVALRCAGQKVVAAKRSHGLYVSLETRSGNIAEKDEYCVLFSKTDSGAPTQIESAALEIAQQVGKVRESARKIPLSRDSRGRYCQEVDLGKPYYHPAFYYFEIHYSDSSKKKRKCQFLLTLE
jgi:hypothetical protein